MPVRVAFLALLLISAPLRGADKPPKYPVETESFTVKLTCDEGPVAGASILLYACRCEEDRGSHFGWPRIWLGGSTILGANRNAIDGLTNQISGKDVHFRRAKRTDEIPVYSAVTDEKGQAKLSGIPCRRNYQVGAYHDDYILPAADRGRRQRAPYICKSDEETDVVIKMQAISETD